MNRRTAIADTFTGLAGVGMGGLIIARSEASAQSLGRPDPLSGSICAAEEIGATTNPTVWWYYGSDCAEVPEFYPMTSPVRFEEPLGCPPDKQIRHHCAPAKRLRAPGKQLPPVTRDTPIDRSTSHLKHHYNIRAGGYDLGRYGLRELAGTDLTIEARGRHSEIPYPHGETYQMVISNRRRAVRVFRIIVTAGKRQFTIGVGQEIDADPAGLPTFHDERQDDEFPKLYIGYLKEGEAEVFFHIVTKN